MKRLAIIGSTGSVGTQVLEVVDKHPDKLKVVSLSANNNVELLKKQVERFHPKTVGIGDSEKAGSITGAKVFSGHDAATMIASEDDYDTLVNCVVGLAGIDATLKAIRKGKSVALANKESLVAAGEIIMREAKKNNVSIMPIDSEHSALFQCLNGEKKKDVKRLILTCSGGPLLGKTKEQMKMATIKDALGHKTWNMGQKISVDSATLMNKGFEVIEAMWLYGMPLDKIDVVIHPQSIIHSMVEYNDGSVLAQLSEPDMRLPIQYALSCPERWDSPVRQLDFSRDLTFQKPDKKLFPCLKYAYEAAAKGGTMPAAMNAANDFMVDKFLKDKCSLTDIPRVIRKIMDAHKARKNPSLEDVKKAIAEANALAESIFSR